MHAHIQHQQPSLIPLSATLIKLRHNVLS